MMKGDNSDRGPAKGVHIHKEAVLAAFDIAACALCMALALRLRFGDHIPVEHGLAYLTYWPLLIALRIFTAYSFGLYDFKHRLTITDHIFGSWGASLFGIAAGALALSVIQLYYAYEIRLSRIVVGLEWGLMMAWFAMSRATLLLALRWTGRKVRIMLIGPVEACRELAGEFRQYAPRALDLRGTVATGATPQDDDILGTINDLETIAASQDIHQAILVQSDLAQAELYKLMAHCDNAGIELFLHPRLGLTVLTNGRVASIAGIPLVPMGAGHASTAYHAGKRILDLIVSLLLLVLLSPVALLGAMAVKLSSPGPALYSQERVGMGGRPFRIYKFRTMRQDAEAKSGAVLSQHNDPRITAAGQILRKLRIDEVPQLYNVLRGDMSLVGPRPERQEFISQFLAENPLYERRLLVKPGLTGLAQIHGRYDTDYTHKLRYDLIYINSISLATDLRILFATIQTVLTGKGAA